MPFNDAVSAVPGLKISFYQTYGNVRRFGADLNQFWGYFIRMFVIALSFLAGNLLIHQMGSLPAPYLLTGLALPLFLCWKYRRRYLAAMIAFAVGLVSAWFAAYLQIQDAGSFEGGNFQALIRVESAPKHKPGYVQFNATVEQSEHRLPNRMRLSMYDFADSPRRGDILRAELRLKPIYGYVNPGGFDYEKYLFSERIGALGYVKDWDLVSRAQSPGIRLRNFVYQSLADKSADYEHSGLLLALAIGERGRMTQTDWDLLAATGVGHLFAISGLHVGLIFGMVFFVFRGIWKRWFLTRFGISANLIAAVSALPWACFYAWFSGFSIPAQRACIMLICLVIGRFFIYRRSLGDSLAYALIIVLLLDPLSSLSISFWFSFLAVAVIVLYLSVYQVTDSRRQWGKLHVYIPFALAPATLLFFNHVALLAPIANLLAIPYVSFIVLPTCLLAALFTLINDDICAYLVQAADFLFALFVQAAQYLYSLDVLQWFHHPPAWAYLTAVIGAVGAVAFSDVRKKLLALALAATLTVSAEESLERGAFEATFLDVGQGLSVFVKTAEHTLLFDTGAKYRSGFDVGAAVVVPYLRWRNVKALDALVVSHADNDHSGGSEAVLQSLPVAEKYMGGGEVFEGYRACRRGQRWIWDDVQFEFLHPPDAYARQGNDASCVLKISAEHNTLLLSADIETAAEKYLTLHYGEQLQTDVLLIPHHGSLTSSTADFVRLTSPRIGIVTSGFQNHFGFPKRQVLERYLAQNTVIYNTAYSGAIRIEFTPDGQIRLSQQRVRERKYWRRLFAEY